MKQILHLELNTGVCEVPADGEFLACVWSNNVLFAVFLTEATTPVMVEKSFYLVNLATGDSVPDGYTFLTAAPRRQHDADNWLVFTR